VVENQDVLNGCVKEGYTREAAGTTSRHSTPLRRRTSSNAGVDAFGGGGLSQREEELLSFSAEKSISTTPVVRGPMTTNGQNLSPSGIIDLECYTSVNRCSRNDTIFELTGDEITNPDLRSFYFQAGSLDDCELWTKALLSDRHSALRDEREAYRQVCDSFQLQLQSLSDMIDEAEGKASIAEKQLYTVRSGVEKTRNQVVNVVREALEHKCWIPNHHHNKKHGQHDHDNHNHHNNNHHNNNNNKHTLTEHEQLAQQLETDRLAFLDQVDQVLASANNSTNQTNGAALVVQLLSDYVNTILRSYTDLAVETTTIEQKLNSSVTIDKATVSELRSTIERLEAEKAEQLAQYEGRISGVETELLESQRVLAETEHHLHTQGMESKMFQTQAKTKVHELSQHKKILKKEVIELRKRIDETEIKKDAASYRHENLKLQVDTEKQKNKVLERYLEKIENQVTVQQNMMEMMSLSGMSQAGGSRSGMSQAGGSVLGRMVGPDDSAGSVVSGAPIRSRLPPSNPGGGGSVRQEGNRLPPSSRSRSALEVQPASTSPPASEQQQQQHVKNQQRIGIISPLSPPTMARCVNDENDGDGIRDGDCGSDGRNQLHLSADYQSPEEVNPICSTPRLTSRRRKNHPNDNNKNKVATVDDTKNDDLIVNTPQSRKEKLNRLVAVLPITTSEDSEEKEDTIRHRRALNIKVNDGRRKHVINNNDDYDDDDDDDNQSQKSHISELTEDRTQRAMDVNLVPSMKQRQLVFSMSDMTGDNNFNTDNDGVHRGTAPVLIPGIGRAVNHSEGDGGNHFPPRYIGSESGSLSNSPNRESDMQPDTESKECPPTKQLSVAARSRMEAESSSNSVNISVPSAAYASATKDTVQQQPRQRSQSPSVFSTFSNRFMDAMDNSVLGVGGGGSVVSRSGSVDSRASSVQPSVQEKPLTLEQRQKAQRERQLQVLKQRGLMRGGDDGGGSMRSGMRR